MLPSFLISALSSRYRAAAIEEFKADHPDAWLVWEPGPWKPAGSGKTESFLAIGSMRQPPPAADALATQLRADPQHPQLTVGRAETSSIPINDATLSATHFTLTRVGETWNVEDAHSSNGTWLDEVRLVAGTPVRLRNGAQIRAGQVFLSYFVPMGMLARIKGAVR